MWITIYDIIHCSIWNQIFVLSFRFRNQQSGFIFNAGNDSPLACSFATSKSWQIQSNIFDKSVKSALKDVWLSTVFFYLSIIFRFLEPCRKTDVTFSNLKVAGNCKEQLASLIWRHICSEKYSAFSYKTLTGISVSWIAFLTVNLLISLSTVFLSTYEKWKLKISFDKRRMILIYWYLSDSYNSEWLVKLDDCTIYCVDYLHSDFWILRFFTFQKKIF